MRLAQGAGATGLTSLRPVRGRIVVARSSTARARTFASTSRRIGQSWREDATNTDTDRLRAKVRAELVPVLREINPRFDESLASARWRSSPTRTTCSPRWPRRSWTTGSTSSEDEVASTGTMLATLSRPMLRRTLRTALARTFPDLSRLDFEHIEALVDGVGIDGFAHDLPDGLRAFDEYGRMVVSGSGGEPSPAGSSLAPGTGRARPRRAGTVIAEEVSRCARRPAQARASLSMPTRSKEDLEVGSARRGRAHAAARHGGTKKLSDLLVDEKVPKRHRALTPVVRDGTGVVWLAGVRMSEDAQGGRGDRTGRSGSHGSRPMPQRGNAGRRMRDDLQRDRAHRRADPRARRRARRRRSATTTVTSRSC